jgi:hypothetical protein
MVNAMIDEYARETIIQNQKSKFDNDFRFYKLISDLHKRIKRTYDEIERGDRDETKHR